MAQLNTTSQSLPIPSLESNFAGRFKPGQSLEKPVFLIAKNDSITNSFDQLFAAKEKGLDSLKENIKSLSQKEDSLKNALQKNINTAKQKIYKAGNEKEIKKIASGKRRRYKQPG